ncbi:MAG: AMP-binding protein [Pseudobutyrivibrio sp.]|uniref:AMP-binding protein n=1 Tax=Pseudobutyrivibrio sp. TaxID=2014367 RepID=UPI0025FF5AC9|nr:AMP-binding protein [Pseudobutyrivibrio sp.]MBQ6464066.1 AMP-binding protein [Pseudobutyrivibrio sp.]
MKNVLEWLEASAEKYGDKTLYSNLDYSMTFKEVSDTAKSVGTSIINENLPAGPIAVIMDKEPKMIASYLGVAYSGRIYAPIDVTLPIKRLNSIFDNLCPEAVVTNQKLYEKVKGILEQVGKTQVKILVVEDLEKVAVDEAKLAVVRENMTELDPLYIIYTSGSSGVPKGVIASHRNVMCYIRSYVKVMGITSDDVLGNQSPLDYIAAIRDIYIPLLTGASAFLTPKEYFMQPSKLFGAMNDAGVTSIGWTSSSMTLLQTLHAFKNDSVPNIKKVCFSGSVMTKPVLKYWMDNMPGALFVNQYGPTEATASCTYYVVDDHTFDYDSVPIGKAYDDYKIYLIKDDGTETKDGELGEICVTGPTLALGYYGNLEKTNQDFVQNPINNKYRELIYKTGDIGKLLPDGNLEFHGRKDRQIKHMGHRIELDEIEAAVSTVEHVGENVAFYDANNEVLVLYYVGEATVKDISIALRKTLPGFMIPRKMFSVDALPKLPNSKIDLKELERMYRNEK